MEIMKTTERITQVSNVFKFIPNFAREVIRAGKRFNVYPCVMLVEGVHHGVGSDPVYYSQEVLRESAAAWNNVPVTVGHPVVNGDHVLCNNDGTIRQEWQIGSVSNATYEDGKLKAEIWIDVALAENKAPGLIEYLENGGSLEVSTGLLAAEDGTAGTWNSENFMSSVMEIVPDHLALLPGDVGACSWNDGCGVRFNVNKAQKKHGVIINERSFDNIIDKVRDYVDSLDVHHREGNDGYSIINYVRAVYPDYFVYKQVEEKDGSRKEQLYKQMYSIDDGDNVVVSGEAQPVKETIEYNSTMEEEDNTHNNTGGKNMSEKGSGTCCPKKVAALITNEKNGYTEDDREWLESMNEAQLQKIIDNAEAKETEVKTNAEDNVSVADQVAEFLKGAPAPIASFLSEGLRTLDDKRAALISKIVNHEGSNFTQEQLVQMETAMIENIAGMIKDAVENVSTGANFGFTFPASVVTNKEVDVDPYVPKTLSDGLGKKA